MDVVREVCVMDLAIYGAQGMALGAYKAIQKLFPRRKIVCFLVTKKDMNADLLSGLPVIELETFVSNLPQKKKENLEVLIATPENTMFEIEKKLEEQGLFCHVRLTSSLWAELMGYYYVCDKGYVPLSALPIGYHRAELHMFMAKFYKDQPLACQYDQPEWLHPIQVGAALCEERIADILDCDGVNISRKNVNYSELTALYWIWQNYLDSKNNLHEYYGLNHYRRVFDFSEEDLLRLVDNEVDVVLPFPMLYEPNIEEHHKRYLKHGDWEAVLEALYQIQPNYAEQFSTILKQTYFYNYNIILARKNVLEEYCNWLFPILERVEELSVPRGCDRHDRYIGYVGESLATLYFMVNRNRLNITHTGCRFLI